jgi:hypothetical protein
VADILSVTNGTELNVQQVSTIIADDDVSPNVTLALDNTTIAENVGVATYTATLSAPSGLPVTVNLLVTGTAIPGVDFTQSASPLVIPAGSTSRTFTITSRHDLADELDETVTVDILSVVNGAELGAQRGTTTIVDDDATPTVRLLVSNATINEGGGTVTYTAQLSAVSGLPVTVNLGFSGTATQNTDFTRPASTSIVIPAGAVSATYTVNIVQDAIDEFNETIVADILTVTNGAELNVQQVSTIIADDDVSPNVTLALNNTTLAENAGVATYTATLSAPSGLPVTVNLLVTGTATPGVDFTQSNAQIVIPAGSMTGTFTVTSRHDLADELDETVTVDILSVVNGAELGAQRATTTILDDDATPTARLLVSNTTIGEGGGLLTYTVQLSAVSGLPVTVNLGLGGTATAGVDYSRALPASITIPAGSPTGTYTVGITQDLLDELNETIVVDIVSVVNATELNTQQVTTTIVDDDLTPTVSLSVDRTTMNENGEVAIVTATLSAASGLPVTVALNLAGTALLGADYTRSAAQIVIPAGSTSASISLTSLSDTLPEPAETILVSIGTVTNGLASSTQNSATITINNVSPPSGLVSNSSALLTARRLTSGTSDVFATNALSLMEEDNDDESALDEYLTALDAAILELGTEW